MDDKKKLLYNLALIQQKISTLYGATYRTVTEIAEVRKAIESGEEFTFSGNPNAAKKAEVLLDRLAASTNALLVNGIEASYTLGEKAVQRDISAYGESDTDKEAVKNIMELAEKDTRESGKNAHSYTTSKRGGLTLSDRVWNLNGNARKEIEIIIQNGILEGKSADEISGSVRGYLNNPDALFRRVLNPKTGNLELSKAAKAYHPGRGVYRSAYKNALRLARTEVNAAYRMAMWEAWQNEPLIESYEIKLSNNHTTTVKGKAVPLVDICDELAGIYPKSFKWVGWHPQCRCDMIPIKISANQFKDAVRAIKKGALEDWSKEQNERQQQKPLPDNFKNWYRKNKTRFKGVKLLPYFIADNTALLKHIRSARVAPAAPVKPITDYDSQISYIKEWQKALGIDPKEIKELEALRLGTDEKALKDKVDAVYTLLTIRQAEWIAEGRKLNALITNIIDVKEAAKYTQIFEDNKIDKARYYKTSIDTIKQAINEVNKLLAEQAAKKTAADISRNMPDELQKGGKWLKDIDYTYSKEFFDLLDDSIRVNLRIVDKGTSYCRGKDFVQLSEAVGDGLWNRARVVYHEFGHTIVNQRGLVYSANLANMRKNQITRLKKKVEVENIRRRVYLDENGELVKETIREKQMVSMAQYINDRVNAIYFRLYRADKKYFEQRGYDKQDVLSQITALMDTLKSLINKYGWGHTNSYFRQPGNKEHEYMAHAFENTFIGNPIFKKYLPDIYQEMVDFIRTLK